MPSPPLWREGRPEVSQAKLSSFERRAGVGGPKRPESSSLPASTVWVRGPFHSILFIPIPNFKSKNLQNIHRGAGFSLRSFPENGSYPRPVEPAEWTNSAFPQDVGRREPRRLGVEGLCSCAPRDWGIDRRPKAARIDSSPLHQTNSNPARGPRSFPPSEGGRSPMSLGE